MICSDVTSVTSTLNGILINTAEGKMVMRRKATVVATTTTLADRCCRFLTAILSLYFKAQPPLLIVVRVNGGACRQMTAIAAALSPPSF